MGHCFLIRRGVPQGQTPSEQNNAIYPIGTDSRPTGNVKIPDNVTSIYQYLFKDNTNVSTVSMPNTVDTIPTSCFQGCVNMSQLNYPTDAVSIPDSCFKGCTSLRTVNISENANVDTIGNSAFEGCSTLKSFLVPKNVRTFGTSIFYGCNQMTTLTIPNEVKASEIPNNFCRDCERLTDVNIPSTVTSIGSYAFGANKALNKIELPTGLKTIGDYAFNSCFYVDKIGVKGETQTEYNIKFPSTLTTIGSYSFEYCTRSNGKTDMKMKLPSSLKTIGGYAFKDIVNLKDIDVDNGSEYTIGERAFAGCTSLSDTAIYNLTKRAGLTNYIGRYTFADCTSLKNAHVSSTNDYMFSYCTSLENVVIDGFVKKDITECGTYIFEYNYALKSVRFETTSGTITDRVIGYTESKNDIEVYFGDGATVLGSSLIVPKGNISPVTKIRLPGTITSCNNSSLTNSNNYYYFLAYGTNLTEVILGDGWSQSVRLNVSDKLTHDSMVTTLNNLKDLTGLATQTITFGETNLAKLSATEKAIATNKNWTLA